MGLFMTEEKALRLFARCYNACDFAPLVRRLGKKATYTAYNRFYVSSGREAVARLLGEKAEELRALPQKNRAYHGFVIVQRDIIGRRADPCLVLTKHEPWQTLGVVRIKCTPLHIKDIRILDPAECRATRGDYAGGEVQ
jgi:hypothetical protein